MEMTDDQKKEYLFWKIRKNLDVGDDTSLKNINQDFDTLLSLDRFNPKYYWLKGSYALLISDSSVAKSNFELALEYDLQGEVTNEVEDLLAQLE
jgi:hypothetical protein